MKYSEFRSLVGDRRLHVVTVDGAQWLTDTYWAVPVLGLPAKVLAGLPFPLPDGSYQYSRGKLTGDHGVSPSPDAVRQILTPHANSTELKVQTVPVGSTNRDAFAELGDGEMVKLYKAGPVTVCVDAERYTFVRACAGPVAVMLSPTIKPATSRVTFMDDGKVAAVLMPVKVK